MKPSKEAFRRYVLVQKSGEFNMLDPNVQGAANITKEEHLYIIKHYSGLVEEYGINLDNVKMEDD